MFLNCVSFPRESPKSATHLAALPTTNTFPPVDPGLLNYKLQPSIRVTKQGITVYHPSDNEHHDDDDDDDNDEGEDEEEDEEEDEQASLSD